MPVIYLDQQSINISFLGHPAMLHLLLQQKKFLVEQIKNLSVEELKKVCEECSISTNQRSAVSFNNWDFMNFYGVE